MSSKTDLKFPSENRDLNFSSP
jgi:amino acid permease